MKISKILSAGIVAVSVVFAGAAQADAIKVLILADDGTNQNAVLSNLIGSDSRFDLAQSATYDLESAGLPTLSYLQQFNSILLYTNSKSVNYDTLGNTLASYVAGGGGVVLSTFFGQEVGNGFGAMDALNPLTNPQSDAYEPLSLGSYNPSDPLMQGVTSLSCNTYCGDYLPGLAPGATLAASWNNGNPLAAYDASDNVADITLFPPVVNYNNATGDYAELFANALAFVAGADSNPVPTPGALALLGLGLVSIGAMRRKLKAR